jgi:hypothetical protein
MCPPDTVEISAGALCIAKNLLVKRKSGHHFLSIVVEPMYEQKCEERGRERERERGKLV